MDEVLTYAEIQRAYDGEWVLWADPQTDSLVRVLSGRVLWHSKDRSEVYRKARELRPQHSAVLFIGDIPAGTVVVL